MTQHDLVERVTGIESRSVSWWPVHEFLAALLDQSNHQPVAGSPAWCALADTDPAKLLALAAAGEHHVLRMEMAQERRAEASKSIAAAFDWQTVGRGRGAAYIERIAG